MAQHGSQLSEFLSAAATVGGDSAAATVAAAADLIWSAGEVAGIRHSAAL